LSQPDTLAVPALAWLRDELELIRAAGLERSLLDLRSAPGATVELDDQRYLLLGSNNYLDLAAHPAVIAGAQEALREYGAGAGASRLVSGTLEIHSRLEGELAALVGAEAALLFSSGYLANVATIPALVGRGDEVFSDALNHASIIDGCRLSGARVTVFPHRDLDRLASALGASAARRRLVVSDSVFSMEGDSAAVTDLVQLAESHDAILMLDESHALGVLGQGGGGLTDAAQVSGRVPVLMGTLSKALGSAGGFIAGSAELVHYLHHRARGFVFDTAPAPAAVGAAAAALQLVRSEPWRRQRLLDLTARLRRGLGHGGLSMLDGEAAIVPLLLGAPERAVAAAARLRERGIIAPAIRPPSVPDGTSRLRLTVNAGFTEAQVDAAIAAIIEVAGNA
jgi:8-amino-7-oxononanoate synthase